LAKHWTGLCSADYLAVVIETCIRDPWIGSEGSRTRWEITRRTGHIHRSLPAATSEPVAENDGEVFEQEMSDAH
jgi:hypothetical protein